MDLMLSTEQQHSLKVHGKQQQDAHAMRTLESSKIYGSSYVASSKRLEKVQTLINAINYITYVVKSSVVVREEGG